MTPCSSQRQFPKNVVGVLVALLLLAVLFMATTKPAAASTGISGTVSCATGNYVEGIWVAATSGTSGWATMNYPGNTHNTISWTYTLTSGTSYAIHVGCGGTPSSWAVTTTSDTVTGNWTMNCYDFNAYPPSIAYKCVPE